MKNYWNVLTVVNAKEKNERKPMSMICSITNSFEANSDPIFNRCVAASYLMQR